MAWYTVRLDKNRIFYVKPTIENLQKCESSSHEG